MYTQTRHARTHARTARPITPTNQPKSTKPTQTTPPNTNTRIYPTIPPNTNSKQVKLVLAAAMWNQPHLLVLDEPTNFLDREALGAFATAIKEFQVRVFFCMCVCFNEGIMRNRERSDAAFCKRTHGLSPHTNQSINKTTTHTQGGVIMISHDREFMGALCTETWLVEDGEVRAWLGWMRW